MTNEPALNTPRGGIKLDPRGRERGMGGGGVGVGMEPSFKTGQTLISSLKSVLSKLKWFTFFLAIFINVVRQKGAIFSHILRYKKGKLETNKTGYVVL